MNNVNAVSYFKNLGFSKSDGFYYDEYTYEIKIEEVVFRCELESSEDNIITLTNYELNFTRFIYEIQEEMTPLLFKEVIKKYPEFTLLYNYIVITERKLAIDDILSII